MKRKEPEAYFKVRKEKAEFVASANEMPISIVYHREVWKNAYTQPTITSNGITNEAIC